ncbi:ATP-binding protein [Catenovulum sp. 2E275]|uniref:HAMP domain-containing sensor histidine kinase n=1 Tax=Catenovulum sp. 2E275 TaxID=2980497 RepID=UPI0021D271B8|nr:ATP-binding protein [Catenovulum sp. 2E275]MCU4674241.1 ATP-binding protein [Catenovulum sp. 2E275]
MSKFFYKLLGSDVSIRRQLLTVIILGVVILNLVGSLLTAWLTNQKLRELITADALEKVESLAELAQSSLYNHQFAHARRLVEHAVSQNSVEGSAILDNKGLVFANKNIPEHFINHNLAPLSDLPDIKKFEDKQCFIFSKPVYLEQLDANVKAQPPYQQIGTVVIKISKKTLNQAKLDIFFMTFAIGIAISLFLVGLINVTINRFTQPIYRLADLMTESKHTGMHLLSKEEGTKEVKKMAQAYNEMIRALDENEETLRKHSEQLEQQVAMRTQELVKARDAALTASRHKSVFLANITHELRTPIQAIIGYIDLVKEELELDGMDQHSADLNKVQVSAERLLTLINDILDLSKVEAGKMDVKISVVEVKPLIENAIDSITPLLDIRQNLLVGPQNTTELFIETDKAMLAQIVINLLSNACKFTSNGTISIDYFCDQTDFFISVKDTGCGIAQDKLAEIFDEFRQVNQGKKHTDNANVKQFSGTGLGLAISQKFANLLGGEILVNSQLGSGSEFKLRLPL